MPRVVEIAAPLVRKLTEEIKWPIAVAMLDVDALVVRYSTIPYSPLSLLHSSINMRLSLVSRALGRAYLAFCSSEQEMLLEVVRQSHHPEDRLAQDRRSGASDARSNSWTGIRVAGFHRSAGVRHDRRAGDGEGIRRRVDWADVVFFLPDERKWSIDISIESNVALRIFRTALTV